MLTTDSDAGAQMQELDFGSRVQSCCPPMTECTFVFLTSPLDVQFAKYTLTHLLKMSAYRFREVIAVADDLPRRTISDRHPATLESFSALLRELQDTGLITRCIHLSAVSHNEELARKHFGSRVLALRDGRGIPLFGWIAGIEAANTEFVVHCDSDMLLHQRGHSWIDEGIGLIEADPLVMFVSPLPGPPTPDGTFPAQQIPFTFDIEGRLRFATTFSSRMFLLKKSRFETMLPTRLLSFQTTGGNYVCTWEKSVSSTLSLSRFCRVHLRTENAWLMHCLDRSSDWLNLLPSIIEKVEEGSYPPSQAGYFDLILSMWT